MIILDGIIIVNKEKGYTSNDVVQIVKKTFNEKVGHTGTLDPMATGVLPILIGKGTLLSKYLINHDKTYVTTLKLGTKTDTGDITGDVIKEEKVDDKIMEEANVLKVLDEIKGEQEQIPPMYSAIKVNGKKLYEYARKGLTIDIQPRKINIYNTELLNIDKTNNEIKFRVSCSKGTYIRTLCEKVADLFNTIGTMSSLNRERVGEFQINQAIKIDEIKENFDANKLISIEKFFQDKNEILLSPRSFIAFINGVKLMDDNTDGIYRIYTKDNEFVGTGIVKNGILKRDIVI